MKLKLAHKGALLVGIPLIFELCAFGMLYRSLERTEQELANEAQARNVNEHMNTITRSIVLASSSLYVFAFSHNDEQADRYAAALSDITRQFEELRPLVTDKPEAVRGLAEVEKMVGRLLVCLDEARRSAKVGDLVQAGQDMRQIRGLTTRLSQSMNDLARPFQEMEQDLVQRHMRDRQQQKLLLLLLIAASILLAVVIALYMHKDMTSRLSRLIENARLFAGGRQLQPRLSGADEIKEVDAVFHDMAEAVKEAARQRQEFMAMIAHDLRSPLTAVGVSMEMLCDGVAGPLAPEAYTVADRSRSNIDRLVKLVNDLLDVEKLESGKMELNYDVFPAALVLEESVQAVSDLAARQGVIITAAQTNEELPGDADKLVQVMVNLLSNAIKYSPAGGTIHVDVSADDLYVRFSVKDQGPGVPAQEKLIIFERFKQSSVRPQQQTTGGAKSTGLGLAICKEVVLLHGGDIGVEDGEAGGSCFWFTLPRKKAMHGIAPTR